jgi:hypothetical protein
MIKENNAQPVKTIATIFIAPSFRLFKVIEVINVKASCDAPKRADAVPDSALKGSKASVVVVGNNIPNGSTKKNRGIS